MNKFTKTIRYPLILLQKLGIFNKLGVYMMPIHYYSSIPDLDKIKGDPHWDLKPSEIPGIDLNEGYQLRLLQVEFPKYVNDYDFPLEMHDVGNSNTFYFNNHMFANTDAEVYYCMIRHFKPHIIIEVGGGRSTQICCAAIARNLEVHKTKTHIYVIEPYPNMEILKPLSQGLITLIEREAQDIDYEFFRQLQANDILFVDSSHVVKSGGEVNYLFLDVFPRLKTGVIVHIHDIRLPYEVPKSFIVDQSRFFTEQYLLQAFLIGNEAFEVLWATYFMTKKFPEKIASIFRSSGGGKYAGGSFWIRRISE